MIVSHFRAQRIFWKAFPDMAGHRNREEVVNTQLAILISDLGVAADAETIHFHGKQRPDVLFQMRGLRVILEGKFSDTPGAREVVLNDAQKRVVSGVAHIAAAIVYPLDLRTASTAKILQLLETARLDFRIISEAGLSPDWSEGTASDLMDAFRRAQESLTSDDIVERTAKALSMQLEGISQLWTGQAGACDRLSSLLGFAQAGDESPKDAEDRRATVAKVAALVLANAYIFQEQLARSDERVSTLRSLEKGGSLVSTTAQHWRWIWENVNFVPIFQLGERVLDELPASPHTTAAIRSLLNEAVAICEQQGALRHDLMGRIYHWLLHHAKYLGTYYTSVPAATILLKLAMESDWPQDFGNIRELADFKVADLACGTGTLLMASAQALTDKFINARAASKRPFGDKDLAILHSTLMQNVMHGYDILPTAVHLTASTLALLAPEVAFRAMNLFVMPMGLDHGKPRLGSLDFIEGSEVKTQFALDHTHLDVIRTGAAMSFHQNAKIPKLDLCVMNPPFVSSRYGNLLFGSLPAERSALQKELSRLARQLGVKSTAGLGAMFVPLADKHIRPGGRMAFVLPLALATGEAWASVRNFLAVRYHLEIVITSHDSTRSNFSENTELSEILFIARRLKSGEAAGQTAFINLWRNPRTIHEALDQATRFTTALRDIRGQAGAVRIIRASGQSIIGEITNMPPARGTENWTAAIFAQGALRNVHQMLEAQSQLQVPGVKTLVPMALCRLDALGTLGYDARDIFDAFSIDRTASQWSPYPAFWDHDAQKVLCIAQQPNAFLQARTEPIVGRKLKDAHAVWAKSGRILLVSRLWAVTHKVLATSFENNVLGNTWWAFDVPALTVNQRKSLLIWLNGSLALLMYFGRRAITRGAWVQMKKPAWASMPILDVRALNDTQLASLAQAYDTLATRQLAPLAQLDADPTRRAIDDALALALGLPSIQPIRALLAREPGLSAREITTSSWQTKPSAAVGIPASKR